MNKKGVLGGLGAIVFVVFVLFFYSFTPSEEINLDMSRNHGGISTAMGSPILGNPDAPVTIVEFGDYQCPQCFKWYHNTKPAIYDNYIRPGKVNMIFMDLAVLGKDSVKASQATYCAEEQGKYWQYHDLLYASQKQIDDGWASVDNLKRFAVSLDLDEELFGSCLDSDKYQKRIQHNIDEAKKAGIRGTPTFIILGSDGKEQRISGSQPFTVFKNVLDLMI